MTQDIGPEQELQRQVQELQSELTQFKVNNHTVWMLLVQISNKLQRSSTSIKTAVSSLLDFDIFWDETTQYEFLQDIDSSTDELADLIVLITLAFRSQAKALEIEPEPNMIQEILETLQNNIAKNEQGIQFTANYPPEGTPVIVDFQYTAVALGLLIEVIISEVKNTKKFTLQATEDSKAWHLEIRGLTQSIIAIIRHFFEQSNDITEVVNQILPESALKLMTARRIFELQNINLCRRDTTEIPPALCLIIPTA